MNLFIIILGFIMLFSAPLIPTTTHTAAVVIILLVLIAFDLLRDAFVFIANKNNIKKRG